MTKKRKKNYIYHDQIQFLTKTIIPRETINSIPKQHFEENVELQPSTSKINLPAAEIQNNKEFKKKNKRKNTGMLKTHLWSILKKCDLHTDYLDYQSVWMVHYYRQYCSFSNHVHHHFENYLKKKKSRELQF